MIALIAESAAAAVVVLAALNAVASYRPLRELWDAYQTERICERYRRQAARNLHPSTRPVRLPQTWPPQRRAPRDHP